MAAGDRLATPSYNGTLYSDMEVTDETAAQGVKQFARLVKVVGDDGSTSGLATSANQTTQTTALNTISSKLTGAANVNAGQATAATASGELVAARATRRSVLLRNTHATASCYIGEGTVTSGDGFLLKAGESVSIDTTAAINGIRDTVDITVAFIEVYD